MKYPSEPGDYGFDSHTDAVVMIPRPTMEPSEIAAALEAEEIAAAVKRKRAELAELDQFTDEHRKLAQLLGAAPEEIDRCEQRPEGLVVHYVGGTVPVVIVPPGRPDAEGKTGVMLLDPTPSPSTNASARIYARTLPAPDPEPQVEDDPEPEPWESDPTLLAYASDLAEAEAEAIEEAKHGGELFAARRRDALKELIFQRRGRLRSEYLESLVPPPTEHEVAGHVALLKTARALLDATTNADRDRVWSEGVAVHEAVASQLRPSSSRPALEAMVSGSEKWLAEHGIEVAAW